MRLKTIRKQNFEALKADPKTPDVIVQRVAEGETLREICASREVPYSLVAQWIAETPGLKAQYDVALQLWGDALAQETVGIADKADRENVPGAKLAVETRMKLASKWDRDRYGEKVKHEHSGAIVHIDAGLVGFSGDLLRRIARPAIENESAAAEEEEGEPVKLLIQPVLREL